MLDLILVFFGCMVVALGVMVGGIIIGAVAGKVAKWTDTW
jgi:low affinity Fe/Cu permease